jgi:acyl carrier protein
MSDIASRAIEITIDKLGVDETEVTLEASFKNDLGADSLSALELIMELLLKCSGQFWVSVK